MSRLKALKAKREGRTTYKPLDEIHAYITERDPASAARLIDSLLKSAFQLANFPHLGRHGRVAGTQE